MVVLLLVSKNVSRMGSMEFLRRRYIETRNFLVRGRENDENDVDVSIQQSISIESIAIKSIDCNDGAGVLFRDQSPREIERKRAQNLSVSHTQVKETSEGYTTGTHREDRGTDNHKTNQTKYSVALSNDRRF